MSLNIALEQKYLPEVEALTALLFEFIGRWKIAPTIEQRLLVESESITLFDRLINLDIELDELLAGRHPEIYEINTVYGNGLYLLRVNIAKLTSIAQLYLQHFNTQQFSIMELIGKLKRINQKKSSLGLWNTNDTKYVLSEKFLNYDNLSANYSAAAACDVDTNQGILTLPVINKNKVAVSKIRIGSQSNGVPGNSDLVISTNNNNPKYAVNEDDNNWFEYERLDSGPVELTLILEFAQEQILNNIVIEPINLGTSLPFEVSDILFSTDGTEGASVKNLVNTDYDKDLFVVKNVGADNAWNLTFLPVQTKTLALKLKSTNSHQIEYRTADGRIVLRDRFGIGIKSVVVNRLEFATTGTINSLNKSIPKGLYAAVPFIDVWPNSPSLFDLNLEVSFDGGEKWLPSQNVDDGIGSTILMNGDEQTCMWRVNLSRNEDAFSTLQSFFPDESLTKQINSTLKTVSRFDSPAEIRLTAKPFDNQIVLIQPKLLRRGDKFSATELGQGKGTAINLKLPFAMTNKMSDSLKVYANGKEYTKQEDPDSLGALQFAYTDDLKEIQFTDDLALNTKVEVVLDKEIMRFQERSDGFYHFMDLPFDPVKSNIEIAYLIKEPSQAAIILPRDQRVINLGINNILNDSFQIQSKSGISYVEVGTRADLLITTNGYYLDYVNGILYLNAVLGEDVVKILFKHQSEMILNPEHYEIVFDGNLPVGIRINKSVFAARQITDVVGRDVEKTVQILTGTFERRASPFVVVSSRKAKALSHRSIIAGTLSVSDDFLDTEIRPEEVPFRDGESEFYGLIDILNEKTSAIASGFDTYVQFNLSAGSAWHMPFGISFSNTTVFNTLKDTAGEVIGGTVGDYHIDEEGVVTVNIGTDQTLTQDIEIFYAYKDPEFDGTNKYSVDYNNGYVYSASLQNTEATITYKVASYKASYDVSKVIDDFTYDSLTNIVSVNTEILEKSNSLVKVIWTESNKNVNLGVVQNYFSPLLSTLAFRFN